MLLLLEWYLFNGDDDVRVCDVQYSNGIDRARPLYPTGSDRTHCRQEPLSVRDGWAAERDRSCGLISAQLPQVLLLHVEVQQRRHGMFERAEEEAGFDVG